MNRTSVIKCVVLQCIIYAFYMYTAFDIQQHTWVKWNISFSFWNLSCLIQLCGNHDLPLHDLPIPKIRISWIEKIWYWLTQNFYLYFLTGFAGTNILLFSRWMFGRVYLIELWINSLHCLAPAYFGGRFLQLWVGRVFVRVVQRTIAALLGALPAQTTKAGLTVYWAAKTTITYINAATEDGAITNAWSSFLSIQYEIKAMVGNYLGIDEDKQFHGEVSYNRCKIYLFNQADNTFVKNWLYICCTWQFDFG